MCIVKDQKQTLLKHLVGICLFSCSKKCKLFKQRGFEKIEQRLYKVILIYQYFEYETERAVNYSFPHCLLRKSLKYWAAK